MEQEIRFTTTTDGVRIAYSTMGEGPPLVKVANWLSHLEYDLQSPVWRGWYHELARHHTFIRYDERGCGLSDWDVEDFSFEGWVRDLEAVIDALGLERFPLLGISQGGSVGAAYAVRHPERVSHLIFYGTCALGWAKRATKEQLAEGEALMTLTRHGWGRDTPAYRQIFTSLFVPDANEEELRSFNELQRVSTSPENAVKFLEEFGQIDVSDLLPRITAPTLVMHAREEERVPFETGRQFAAAIPNSRFAPLETRNHILLDSDPAQVRFLAEIRSFLGVDAAALEEAAPGREGKLVAAHSGADTPSFFQALKQRKLVQWALTYLAGAWVVLQVLDVIEGPWHLADWTVRVIQLLIGLGFLITLVVAWYHGERGRQKLSGAELIMIALLLAIAGLALAILAP